MKQQLKDLKKIVDELDIDSLNEIDKIISDRIEEIENEENTLDSFIDKAHLIMTTTNHTWNDGKVPTKEKIGEHIDRLLEDVSNMDEYNYKCEPITISSGGIEIEKDEDGEIGIYYKTGIIL